MERLVCFICLIFGYLCGCFQTAYIVGKIKHIDIRKKGSGNLGTTNVFRTVGVKAGIITFVGDILKVFIAALIVYLVVLKGFKLDIDRVALFLYTGFGVVLGHDFPFYLKFKGGKGVAATAAALITIGDWRMIVAGVLIFFGIALATKYVSVASLSLIGAELIIFTVFTLTGLISLDKKWQIDCFIIVFLMTVLVFWQHRKNLKRLAEGTENKFTFKKQRAEKEENK